SRPFCVPHALKPGDQLPIARSKRVVGVIGNQHIVRSIDAAHGRLQRCLKTVRSVASQNGERHVVGGNAQQLVGVWGGGHIAHRPILVSTFWAMPWGESAWST